jgi:cytochrome c peroxidase
MSIPIVSAKARVAFAGAALSFMILSPIVAQENSRFLQKLASTRFETIPRLVPEIAANPSNPAKVELGKMLFFEPRLSAHRDVSCNSCHDIGTNGSSPRERSVASENSGTSVDRDVPTVYNAALNHRQFWDGRAPDLNDQARQTLATAGEMGQHPALMIEELRSIPEYVDRFSAAFPEENDPITLDHVTRALECFEATLITPDGTFDQFLNGNLKALSAEEKAGLHLFLVSGCALCHEGITLGGTTLASLGVFTPPGNSVLPPGDQGRFEQSHDLVDTNVFRAAPLRNVARTAPYFHSGRVSDLHVAVSIMGQSQLDRPFSDLEVDQIVAFLRTLSGRLPEIAPPPLPAAQNAP